MSYGKYQFTSQTTRAGANGGPNVIVVGGRVKDFISWSGYPWSDEFEALIPGTSSFSAKWREVVLREGAAHTEVEHAFIKHKHFDVQIETIKRGSNGEDFRYHSHALNDVIWSVSVQHGPQTGLISGCIHELQLTGVEPTLTQTYDELLIREIYKARGKMNPDNTRLVRFSSVVRADVIRGLKNRFITECAKALLQLKNEEDY